MRRLLLVGGLSLALVSVGSSGPALPEDDGILPADTPSQPHAPPSMDAKPGHAAGKAEPAANGDAKKPDAAASKAATDSPAAKRDPNGLEQCLRSWDAATHIARGDWGRVCRQIAAERARRTAAEQRGR